MALTRALLALACVAGPALAAPADAGWRAYATGDFAGARAAWDAQGNGRGDGQGRSEDPEAWFGLGLLYDLGQGVAADSRRACGLYERAGGAGHVLGAFNAGVMHDSGRCGPDRADAAAVWYARAAAAGLGRAQFNMGQLYASGEGVPRNPELAAAWFRAAAANGIAAAAGRAVLPVTPGGTGPLLPVQPASPAEAERVPGAPGLALVWTVPPQPGPVRFFVELVSLGEAGPRAVLSDTVGVSALALPRPLEPGRYAWRVSTVAADGPHYVPGPWRSFSAAAPAGDR